MTASEITICLDFGTTGIKAAAFDEQLNCLCNFYTENQLLYPAPGLVEQDPAHFLGSAHGLIRQIVATLDDAARRVVTICCSGQMAGIQGIDADWNPVGHYDAILDPRSAVCRPLVEPHEAQILQYCGGLTTQLEKMLYWRDYFPKTYAQIRKFVAINGFVAGKLAGLKGSGAFTDLSFASVNGLLNAVTGDWDPELLGIFDLPREVLPKVVAPESVVGTIDRKVAAKLGLPQSVQILAGAGDGAATYAGSGMNRSGLALDLAGSACVFGVYSEHFLPDVKDRLFLNMKSPVAPGFFVLYVNQFGRTHRWFMDAFCSDLVQHSGLNAAYAALDEQAATLEPGCNGLFATPHLSGRASPPKPHLRGAWLGFGLGYTRAHFYRALLESHAVEFAVARSRMGRLDPTLQLEEVIVSGGGSRSDFWSQLKANALGVKYKRLVDSDLSTLLGDALIAAKARGWAVLGSETGFLKFDREYRPDSEAVPQYEQLVRNYRTYNDGLDPLMSSLFN